MFEQKDTEFITLSRFVLDEQKWHKEATGDLSILLSSLQVACKFVESIVRKAGLVGMLGEEGSVNVQGEGQKKLDVLANKLFIQSLKSSGCVAYMVSEENKDVIIVEPKSECGKNAKYCVAFDPIDGSSNIDTGINVGTIFGVFRMKEDAKNPEDSFLVSGNNIIVAGYCMYGSSCNLVITLGNNNVNGFTLNPSLGEFILTHPNIRTPEHGDTYSINEGKYTKWDEATKAYIDFLKLHQEGGKTYASRYIGSMVADVHRTLMSGGIFAYPVDSENTNGKLRTLYESFPMAFLCEQAGGKATTGAKRVLDIVPRSIHDRCPIFLGSKENVETVEEFFEIYSNNLTPAFR